jgi:hypothetical protein
LIHTRSANAKWLYEISHRNPVWLHPEDARRLGVQSDDLIKVETERCGYPPKHYPRGSSRPGQRDALLASKSGQRD